MAELQAPMPQLPIKGDFRVQFEAIDPTTGAAVAGVNISQAVIYAADSLGGGTGADLTDVLPLYSPLEVPEAVV